MPTGWSNYSWSYDVSSTGDIHITKEWEERMRQKMAEMERYYEEQRRFEEEQKLLEIERKRYPLFFWKESVKMKEETCFPNHWGCLI